MKQKKILILGGNHVQTSAIKKAKALGYTVITADYLPDNPGHQYADAYYNVSTVDQEKILHLARKLEIDGILSYASDVSAPTSAYVAEKMGLPGNPLEAVEILCHKDRFRRFLSQHGFAVPRACGCSTAGEVLAQMGSFPLPAILKPVDSSGSKGITVLRSWDSLPEAVDQAFAYSLSHRVILEEFIENAYPYLIGGDIFVEKGEVVLWGLMNCHRDPKVNPLVPVGKSYPPELSDSVMDRVRKETQRLIREVGIRRGPMNLEILVDHSNNIYFVDVGPRSGGNMIPELLGEIYGIDLVKRIVEDAMGEKEAGSWPSEGKCCATCNLHARSTGILRQIRFHPEIVPYVKDRILYAHPGDPVEYCDNAAKALGIVFLEFKNRGQMAEIMGRMGDLIEVCVDTGAATDHSPL